MARKCQINSNKSILTGNNVSHSRRRTKRKFLPNIQSCSLMSDILRCSIKFKSTTSSIRSIERKNGLDSFLLNTTNSKLSPRAVRIKKIIIKSLKKANKKSTL